MGRGEKKSMPSFFDYTLSNLYTAGQQPNTIHVSDTGLSYMFRKQLFEKAISVFDFTMPDNWDKDYFRYSLFIHVSFLISKMEGDLLRPAISNFSSSSFREKISVLSEGLQPSRAM